MQHLLRFLLRFGLQKYKRCARARRHRLLATSGNVLHLTGDHEIPEERELVDDNDRHLEAQRNFQNSAYMFGFEDGEPVLAICSSSAIYFFAAWERAEVRSPLCARVVKISVRYLFCLLYTSPSPRD